MTVAASAVTPTATATMPNQNGLDHDAAWTRYAALDLDHACIRYVASNDVPLGAVIAQHLPAATRPSGRVLVTLTYRRGPAVPLDDLPSQGGCLDLRRT